MQTTGHDIPSAPSPTHIVRTTGAIAEAVDAELTGPADVKIDRIAAVNRAGPGAITFLRSRRFAKQWPDSRASAAIVSPESGLAPDNTDGRPLLHVADADVALTKLLRLFAPPRPNLAPGVHPTAVIDASATIGQHAHVGPHCVIGADAVIGDGAILISNVHVGREAEVGAITTLHPGVVILDRCIVGSACILYPNVVIGADGFGYHPSPDGRGLTKVPHIGIVRIGDGVEIGANSAVDRAKFGETVIGDGTKIDNLCQIGHNCNIGRCVIVCGCSGIAGSVTIGDGAILGAATGVCDALTVGPGARTGARSAVMNDIPAGETWVGYPAVPGRNWARAMAALKNLSAHLRVVRRLAKLEAADTEAHADDD